MVRAGILIRDHSNIHVGESVGGVQRYVALMGGPSGLCLQGAHIGWLNAQPLDGDHFNPNVDIDQVVPRLRGGYPDNAANLPING